MNWNSLIEELNRIVNVKTRKTEPNWRPEEPDPMEDLKNQRTEELNRTQALILNRRSWTEAPIEQKPQLNFNPNVEQKPRVAAQNNLPAYFLFLGLNFCPPILWIY